MYTKPVKFFRAVKHAWNWHKALNFAEEADFENCASILDQITRDNHSTAGVYLLQAYALRELGRNADAVKSLLEFEKKLDFTKRYSDEEKNYLYCYASCIAKSVATSSTEVNFLDLRGDFEKIDRDVIGDHIIRKFPLENPDNKSFKQDASDAGAS